MTQPHPLSFSTLRAANTARLPTFRNARGELAHPPREGVAPGDDWAVSQWANAVTGELGEFANMVKKLERGDYALDDVLVDEKTGQSITVRAAMGKELADVICYADLAAKRIGVDLGESVLAKFNEISARVGAPIYIRVSGGALRVVDERALDNSNAWSPLGEQQ